MGIPEHAGRIAVFHKNVPNTISKITAAVGDTGVNISDMTNKSKDDYAYTLLDVDKAADDALISSLEAIEGVIKVRVVK